MNLPSSKNRLKFSRHFLPMTLHEIHLIFAPTFEDVRTYATPPGKICRSKDFPQGTLEVIARLHKGVRNVE